MTKILNFITYKEAFNKVLQIEYLDPSKEDIVYETKPITKIDFLSRTSQLNESNVVFPMLKEESLMGILFWCTDATPEVLNSSLMNARKEFQLVPRNKYDYYKEAFNICAKKYNEVFGKPYIMLLPDYETNQTLTVQQINA
jgi:hypothetical protein